MQYLLNLSKCNSRNKNDNNKQETLCPQTGEGCKSGKKGTRSTSAVTPRKLKSESNSTAGGIWRLGLSSSQEDLLAVGETHDPKQQGSGTRSDYNLTSQLRLPITCTCKEEPRQHQMLQDRLSIQVSPLPQAHQKSHFLHEVSSSTKSLPAFSHRQTLNQWTFYKITDYSSSSKVSRSWKTKKD